MNHWQANLILLLAGAIWGMGFVAQASAMDDIGPYLFIGLRFLVATIVILPFFLREARQFAPDAMQKASQTSGKVIVALSLRDWLKFVLIGLSLFAGTEPG